MKNALFGLSLLLVCAIMPCPPLGASDHGPDSVEVTYIANEGFLVALAERRVVFDALFPGLRHYAAPSRKVSRALEEGQPPFDGIDLALASHHHRDHFGPEEVRRFLLGNPGAVFVATPQAVAEVDVTELGDRLRELYPAEGATETTRIGEIEVTALNLHHGRGSTVQNLGLLVDLGGFKVLHVGDTEISADEIRPLGLRELRVDLALVPAWLLTEPRFRGVVEEIGLVHVAAMHLANEGAPTSWFGSAGSRGRRIAQILDEHPEVWVPTEPLESRSYPVRP